MKQEKVFLVQESAHWAQIQALAQNAVVQVFAQVGRFNWIEPYNVTDQYENRGSAFFVSDQGFLVTNYHVIDEAKYVWIHVPALGRRPIEVSIVGVCPERDLALLQVKPQERQHLMAILKTIPFLVLGDSDQVQRTDGVLALGYPFGQYRLKSATGVVSGYESIKGQSLLQTTAAINPGSSGGPLLDARGRVVGVIVSSIEYAFGVGYAIPSNELRMIIDDLYTTSLVRKPIIGVRFSMSSDEQARYLGNPQPAGLYITHVFKNFLFDQAGIQSGDMLYEFNNHRIDAYGDATVPWAPDKTSLIDVVSRIQVSDTVRVVVYRKGERIEKEFVFASEYLNPIRLRFPDYEAIEYEAIAGLVVMELADNHLPLLFPATPTLSKYDLYENKERAALVITHVLPGSYAHQLRALTPGDVITHVNDMKVSTLTEFRTALKSSVKSRFVTIETERGHFVVFALERIIADEPRLSTTFGYPLSSMIAQLQG